MKKSVVHSIKKLLGMRLYPRRYDQLLEDIDCLHPKTILEIGTNNGLNAVRLLKRASQYRNNVEYYGFDLFESMNEATFMHEFSLAAPTMKAVENYLDKNGCFNRSLFAGNTCKTLPSALELLPKMDLVFIDGGHSEETVASDWRNVQSLLHADSVVYFDDYPNWGVGPVVDAIDRAHWDVKIMPIEDVFPVKRYFGFISGSKKMGFKFARVKPIFISR